MASDNSGVYYACRCLNVRIITAQSDTTPPDHAHNPDYTPVFVKDDGISVTHPQVTVRLTSRGETIPGTSRCHRYTALSCLFCNLAIYRVHQVISLDVEGNESTLLPTEEWVEHEIMKSASGWIEVHKNSLVGEKFAQAHSSPTYSPLFSLILPPNSSSRPSSPKNDLDDSSASKTSSSETPLPSYLSDMRTLFLPPPFTSSHPIFVHLSAIATKQSQELRAAAEQRISDFVKAETAGIEVKEKELKSQVESLWKNFRQHLSTVQQDGNRPANLARSPTRVRDISSNGFTSPSQVSASVTIRSFVPQPISPAPLTTSSSLPRLSALSASLATTSFHHPREAQGEPSSVSEYNGSVGSSSSTLSTPRSGSSTLVHPAPRADATNVLQYKRNINDAINTQVSYRYLINLDEDMARYKRSQEEALKKQREAEMANRTQDAGPSHDHRPTSPNGDTRSGKFQPVDPQSSTAEGTANPESEETPSRGRDKGKRKVTFDVEPAVVTIQNKDDGKEEEAKGEASRDMIFPLEDLEETGKVEKSADEKHNTLPLLEQPVSRPSRTRTTRPQNSAALEAFSSLRPSSLPNPSHIRPMRSQPGVDSSSQVILTMPRPPTAPQSEPPRTASSPSLTSPNEHDAALLRLVAADTPSHRGAWTPESKAWQAFTRRQDSKDNLDLKNIPEEREGEEGEAPELEAIAAAARSLGKKARVIESDDDEDEVTESSSKLPIAGSLPVNIRRLTKVKEQLTLASYRSPAAIPEQPSVPPSPGGTGRALSSSAIRRAAYAERDRNRSMDPGALDFATEEDEDEEESEGEVEQANAETPDAGEKARKHALRILQARSELPGEGMWRSLA
ncbi:hypothetical protein GALMADRAFT_151088 [Galerina marginata CBS 339.88]|uniref:Uncharacterized protein n=1 Tax=Galerina marginata (strain CBS 339.88) TaxID=685588 RepID=A0A067TLP3_GALM3|nr:hypothetical protein GALMADRAFT_151088 [Galerina marginata CBS 339.88]